MTKLENYFEDGANYQAQMVMLYVKRRSQIDGSWDGERKEYKAEVLVGRWENCREQGYCVMLKNSKHEQINIAFFEHRNSDSICAIKWLQNTFNTPSINTAQFGDLYKTKWDTSKDVSYMEIEEMGDCVVEELTSHWMKGEVE